MIKRILMLGISPSLGGTESVIYSMLPYWRESGLIFDFINTYDVPLYGEEELKKHGSRVWLINLRRRGRLRTYHQSIRAFFDEHGGDYEGVWINIQEPEHTYILKQAKRRRIACRIVVAHNAPVALKMNYLRRVLVRFERRRMNRLASLKLAVSSLAGEYAFGRSNYHVVYSGIDIARFTFSLERRQTIRAKLCINDGSRLFISAGRFCEQKNQKFLLDVFKRINEKDANARFLLIGHGELERDLREYARVIQLKNMCFITDCDDISPYLDAADAFVFPSLHEGMGMVLIEAQCSGLPCFASNRVIPKEAALSGRFVWVELERTPEEWADMVLSADIPSVDQRLKSGEQIVSAGLTNEKTAQVYWRLIIQQ